MNPTNAYPHDAALRAAAEVPFGSNGVRLSLRQCAVAAILIAVAIGLIPRAWQHYEPLEITPDYRIPYALGNDYWHYARTCRQVSGRGPGQILLVGDSVIWGHYVSGDGTLSHYLNERAGADRFVNLGLDGVHPVALCGLVESYGSAIRDRQVVLNCNLLWISSRRHDLSAEKEFAFNHPGLVPQFRPTIPCYRAPVSERLGAVVARNFSFLGWAEHMRMTYFDGQDLAAWTRDHPYENPLGQVTGQLPSPDDLPSPPPDARPWTAKGITPFRPDWVELDASLQWRFFRRTIEVLQARGNRVFVLVGPFNEHLLTAEGLRSYQERKDQVAAWLLDERIPHLVPPALPSDLYADASHPTADGYRRLAQWLAEDESFAAFQAGQRP
jgi:hypothetical protein